ncbi:MAG: hypothetical protein WA996_02240 [Candidatus Promineifilaceae bacterium]
MPVAKAAFSIEQAQMDCVAQTQQALWDGLLDEVINAWLDFMKTEDISDPAYLAARYFDRNRHRMVYPAFRQQGYQIGSETIESTAKQIGMMRMKVVGAIWNEDNARKVAKARDAYLSNEWDALASYRALPRAA